MRMILFVVWVTLCSHTTFKSILKKHKVKYHEIVYNQARLETGNFKSRGFKELNNPKMSKKPKYAKKVNFVQLI